MSDKHRFKEVVQSGYAFKGPAIRIGSAILDGTVVEDTPISIPLATMNRHGLVTGATGGGKTKSFQVIAEALSDAGVPVLLLDIKGDMSGLAAPGTTNDKIDARYQKLGLTYEPKGFPVEFLTLSEGKGVRLRATVSEFGPILMSKILGLNDTQGGIVAMMFKYCDDNKLPLLDLKDFIKVLQYVSGEGKKEIQSMYGNISTTSTGTILRKVIELQQQGADIFFGEKSFEVEDLMRTTSDGKGMLSILRVTDIQDKPKLFSTFMLQMLAEIYSVCPELGDVEKPRLVMFIDEAHLIFSEASKALLDQLNTVIKLIRSKGIGIYFCTQIPTDIPSSILSQLGLKIQHSLRAFTAKDRETIKQTAANYPLTEFYDTAELMTQLGIGEALVTSLNEKGIPTPLVHVLMCTPRSRMDILAAEEVNRIVASSNLVLKYDKVIDEKSAHDMLSEKIEAAAEKTAEAERAARQEKEAKAAGRASSRAPKTLGEKATGTLINTFLRQGSNVIVRSVLGALGVGGKGRSSKSSWF